MLSEFGIYFYVQYFACELLKCFSIHIYILYPVFQHCDDGNCNPTLPFFLFLKTSFGVKGCIAAVLFMFSVVARPIKRKRKEKKGSGRILFCCCFILFLKGSGRI